MKKKASNKKHYSIQEANAALPLVRAIVADIVALAAEMREHYASIEQVPRNDAGEFLRSFTMKISRLLLPFLFTLCLCPLQAADATAPHTFNRDGAQRLKKYSSNLTRD